ncbi:MAG: sigma-70 family RNA polymerase sigma factor, partial [Alphaproteobacteria bacterium]
WFVSDDDNPEEVMSDIELRASLKDALKQLPEREALLIQLYYVEELNVYEIAEVLDITTGRVSQIKKSAVSRLRQFLSNAETGMIAS